MRDKRQGAYIQNKEREIKITKEVITHSEVSTHFHHGPKII